MHWFKLDKKLIADLLSVAEFKEKFFMKIGEALVFDTNRGLLRV